MPILGAHMSIAGGYYRAVEAAKSVGCDVVQLFTKNNNQWKGKAITDEEVCRFTQALQDCGITHPISHASYLINLASPNPELWEKSVAAMVDELDRATQLKIPYVIVHPGAFIEGSEEEGLDRIVRAVDAVADRSDPSGAICLLETTAGQGTNLGWRFEHLGYIRSAGRCPERLAICLDTCHMFAAGYPMVARKDYLHTMRELDRLVGLQHVRAIHLNDSMKPCGSRVDRHDHIGRGQMGLEPFRHLLNDRRFSKVPMYLETAKGEEDGVDLDRMNLETLRGLTRKPTRKTRAGTS